MKASLKLLLYTQKDYSDGSHPVILQFIIDRKVKRKVICSCKEKDWDFKTNRVKARVSGSAYTNNHIAEQYALAERDLFNIKSGKTDGGELFIDKKSITLNQAFDKELERLKADMKAGTYNKVIGFRKQLSEFTNIDALYLDSMDLSWFEKLTLFFKNLGNNGVTIQKKIKTIRAVVARYNPGNVSEDLKTYKVASLKTTKKKLTAEEFAVIESLHLLDGDLLTAVRDLFLLQVYLRGIRVGDILQAYSSQFSDGKFSYQDDKTGKVYTIKLIPRAVAIVERYSGKHERLFPFMKWTANKKLNDFDNKRARMKVKETCTAVVNKYLKIIAGMAGINKPLSSHIARHTYARMAIDKINNPMITMELLGHSSLAMHQMYLNDIRKDDELDKANDDIFG